MKLGTTDISAIKLGSTDISKAYLGNSVVYESGPDYTEPFYIEDVSGSGNTLSINKGNRNAPTLTIEKSTNGRDWSTMGQTSTTAITATVPANGKLYLRCNTGHWAISSSYYNKMTCTGNYNIGGNIMSLLYGSSFTGNEKVFPTVDTFTLAYLFYNSTKLLSSEKLLLPATTLAEYSYAYTFYGCTSLTTAPALPATTLTEGCYAYAFYGCASLTTAPELPATTLAKNSYQDMFLTCTSLNYIKCFATDLTESGCTSGWVGSVSSSGTFVGNKDCSWTRGSDGIPTGWVFNEIYDRSDITIEYFTIVNPNDSNITLSKTAVKVDTTYNVNYPTLNLYYSYDKETWTSFSYSATVYANSVLYLKGNNKALTAYKSGYGRGAYSLRCNGNFYVRGNISSLLQGDAFAFYDPFVKFDANSSQNCLFGGLFKSSTNLVDASNLYISGKKMYNYSDLGEMFYGCTKLVRGPKIEIQNTSVESSAKNIFGYCTSLSEVTMLFNTVPSNGLTLMLNSASSTGTFYTKSTANWPTGSTSGIPSGWTRVNV